MDRITLLPDHLLLMILSLVPTKTVFDAQVVSKRWRDLWRLLPSLYFDYAFHKSESKFLAFIHITMELLESPVLDRLTLRVAPTETSPGIVFTKDHLAKRPFHELELISTDPDRILIEKGIYQLQNLVILRLESVSLEDGNSISLKSLKVLHLFRVKYSSDESLSNLLSTLPSLGDLILDRCLSETCTTTLSIAVTSLKRLTVLNCPNSCRNNLMRLNVNALSLKYLSVEDYWRNVSISDEKMEELMEADVNVTYTDTEKLLRSLVSVKRLSLCLVTSKIPGVTGNAFFDQLVRLEICTCQKEWWDLLERILLYSPKLRVLKLHQRHCFGIVDPADRWKEPSFVPECFASQLETFEWRDYEGTEEEKELASYILRNAPRLKIATIYPVISHPDKTMHEIRKNTMRTELENLSRCLFTCKLVFK